MIKINLDLKKEDTLFLFYVTIENTSNEVLDLNLSNNSGGLARKTIKLYNYDKNAIEPGYSYMTPIKNKIEKTVIGIEESVQFFFKARLECIENHFFLEFKGINFNLKKNKKYYIQMEYLENTSNMLEFTID